MSNLSDRFGETIERIGDHLGRRRLYVVDVSSDLIDKRDVLAVPEQIEAMGGSAIEGTLTTQSVLEDTPTEPKAVDSVAEVFHMPTEHERRAAYERAAEARRLIDEAA